MKIMITVILIKLIITVSSVIAAAPASTPPTKLSSVTTVPIKLGSYQFLQGNKSFADKIVRYQPGSPAPDAQYQHAEKALNRPDYRNKGYSSFVSLGCHGQLVVQFTDNVLMDGDGMDLLVYEVGPAVEPTKVEISKDGVSWVFVGNLKGNTRAIDLQGKVSKTESFYFVKLTDDKIGACKKSKEGINKDQTAGADIDAIAVLNQAPPTSNTTLPATDGIGDKSIPGIASASSLQYTLTSAEQGTGLNEFQIILQAPSLEFKDRSPSNARLVYWGDQDIEPVVLSVKKTSNNRLTAKLPTGIISRNFSSVNGMYKIGLIEGSNGGFISNTLQVIRHQRSEGPGGDGGSDGTDADGDGHDSLASGGDDCDDGDPNRYPGNYEVGDDNGHDEDCNPNTYGGRDLDGDGFVDSKVCNLDNAGFTRCGTDCDDSNPGTHINIPEVCDGIDNNCDGLIDEGVRVEWFKDADRDRFGDPAISRSACFGPDYFDGSLWSTNSADCDDSNPNKNPLDGCD